MWNVPDPFPGITSPKVMAAPRQKGRSTRGGFGIGPDPLHVEETDPTVIPHRERKSRSGRPKKQQTSTPAGQKLRAGIGLTKVRLEK